MLGVTSDCNSIVGIGLSGTKTWENCTHKCKNALRPLMFVLNKKKCNAWDCYLPISHIQSYSGVN